MDPIHVGSGGFKFCPHNCSVQTPDTRHQTQQTVCEEGRRRGMIEISPSKLSLSQTLNDMKSASQKADISRSYWSFDWISSALKCIRSLLDCNQEDDSLIGITMRGGVETRTVVKYHG